MERTAFRRRSSFRWEKYLGYRHCSQCSQLEAKIIIAKIAQKEFDDAKAFYEIEQAGLGIRFEEEVKKGYLLNELFFICLKVIYGR